MLRNRKYIGEYTWGDVKNNCIPPIIDKDIFEKAQKKMKENGRNPQRFQSREDYVLSGKLICGKCGSLMIGDSCQKPDGRIYSYYKCSNRKHGKGYKIVSISKDVVEDYVCFRAMEFLSNEVNVDRLENEIYKYQLAKTPTIENLEARIGETSKKMKNIINAIEAGLDPTELKGRYNELNEQRCELEHSLDEEKDRNPIMTLDDIKQTLMRCQNVSLISLKEKKILIDLLGNTIYLKENGTIDIIFNYRQKEPQVPLSLLISTTNLSWSTIKHAWQSNARFFVEKDSTS